MNRMLTIARREFGSYFNGPAAYIVVCLFLLVLGNLFWHTFFLVNQASVRMMFERMNVLLLPTAPAISMGLLSEEKRNGTIEVLLTMPVRDTEVVLGKFLGALGLFATLLVLTLTYPLSVSTLGQLDWGPVWVSYLGIFLQGSTMIAIGLWASSWTDNQLIAFFVSGIICVALWIIYPFLPFLPHRAASLVEHFSFGYHFQSMLRGVIDSRNIVYFLSLTGLCLAMAFRSLERRRWS